jgi:ABC-2 type transport system ATP-binding protein
MDSILLESVSKTFRHRPALFNWLGKEAIGETRAIDGVSLGVAAGNVLALLGPNGSGKTTLLKLISTMFLPDAGRVFVEGHDTRLAGHAVRKKVGFVIATERSFFPRLSARENLDFFAALDDVPRHCRAFRIRLLLKQVGLGGQSDTLVMKFSSGMYQRLGVARALLKWPSILLLDEPTRSLDPASTDDFWNAMKKLRDTGCTVIVATHNFEEASALGDSLAVLQRGRLVHHENNSSTDPRQLRSMYLDVTAQTGDFAMAAGGWR